MPETEIVLVAVTGTTDYARFPKRPRVTVTFSRPAEGGYRLGEDHGEFAARLLGEIRAGRSDHGVGPAPTPRPRIGCAPMKTFAAGMLAIAALAIRPPPPTPSRRSRSLGWTTQAGSQRPAGPQQGDDHQCLDMGTGQRTLHAIVSGKKIAKGTKVGHRGLGRSAERRLLRGAVRRRRQEDRLQVAGRRERELPASYGFSFAAGPFGPINIDGEWHAKVLVKGKQVAKGSGHRRLRLTGEAA